VRRWSLSIVIAACAASTARADEAPTCDERVDAMVARVSTLSINGRYDTGIVGVTAVVDEPTPTTLWLVHRGSDPLFELSGVEVVPSSRATLDRDVRVALARHPLPIAYDVGSNDRVSEARQILRAISAHGPGYVLVHRADPPEADLEARGRARHALRAIMARCRKPIDARQASWLDDELVAIIARAERWCGCRDVLAIEAAIDTIADRRGLFVLTYDRHGPSLGRFADDARFEDVVRAAEALPLAQRRRGVRF
jgi:hypothetical protein